MWADLIVINMKKLYTPYIKPPVRGKDLSLIKEIDNAFIAIKDGLIIDFGDHDFQTYIDKKTVIHDALGKIGMPGFIDSHTHLVHGGTRENEYAQLRSGTPYLEILKQGGGILGTVAKTRHASFDELYDKSYDSLTKMMTYGVTTVEAKSGYGLNLETEVKQLKVAKKLLTKHKVKLISTYMGAHAVPKEFKENKQAYINQVIVDLKYIKKNSLAEFVDVFCETGVFSIQETRQILAAAKKIGFKVKMHADEIDPLGGAGLGVELKATSVDHLLAISDKDINKLAKSDTIANLLPGTAFYLNKPYANARKMIDANVAVAVSGDYNPGSCPTENFLLIMHLASSKMKMTPKEILNAVTVNPAYHLGIDDKTGTIAIGKEADLVLLEAPNLAYVLYHFGINHTKDVFINGRLVVENGLSKGDSNETY